VILVEGVEPGHDSASLTAMGFCVRTVSHTPETPVKHPDLQGHVDAYRCCVKSLISGYVVDPTGK